MIDKKLFRATFSAALIVGTLLFCGCNQIKDQAQALRKNGEQVVKQAGEQVEKTKNEIIETKNKIDEKARQLQDAAAKLKAASEAVDKLGK